MIFGLVQSVVQVISAFLECKNGQVLDCKRDLDKTGFKKSSLQGFLHTQKYRTLVTVDVDFHMVDSPAAKGPINRKNTNRRLLLILRFFPNPVSCDAGFEAREIEVSQSDPFGHHGLYRNNPALEPVRPDVLKQYPPVCRVRLDRDYPVSPYAGIQGIQPDIRPDVQQGVALGKPVNPRYGFRFFRVESLEPPLF